MSPFPSLAVVIPAAGVGSRMQANKAKQYIQIQDQTILEHTLSRFLHLAFVTKIYIVVSADDERFTELPLTQLDKVEKVIGGKERADSVLNGINQAQKDGFNWVMVHDAARPCVSKADIEHLYRTCLEQDSAGILAAPVKDTMKRSRADSQSVAETVERNNLWHALTPQCAKTQSLQSALLKQLQDSGQVSKAITDEASALELAGEPVILVTGSAKNIKITMPEDLALAEFYLAGIDE